MTLLWLKAFHVFFMVAWFAGIFYLPRLFVYHAENNAKEQKVKDLDATFSDENIESDIVEVQSQFVHTSETLKTMERRLLFFVTPFAIFTLIFGIALIVQYGRDWFRVSGWLHTKLLLVMFLYAYHGYCFKLLSDFKKNRNRHSPRFYRVFNEIPVLILLAIIILAVVKPY